MKINNNNFINETHTLHLKHLSIMAILLIVASLFSVSECKQTIMMSSFDSKNDKILFRILQQTNYLLQSTKKINNKNFECFSIIKNNLIANKHETYFPIDYSINVYSSALLQEYYKMYKELKQQKAEEGETETDPKLKEEQDMQLLYHKLDSILDILKGQCLYFRTVTFLTEYCHKGHVRQFDDDLTKVYNQKPLYEDFNLGLFSEDRKAAFERHKVLPQYAPKRSDLSKQFSVLQVESIYNYVLVDMVKSNDGKVIHSDLPLVEGSTYLDTNPMVIEMICDNEFSKDTKKDIGLVVSPFQAVFIKKQGECQQYQRFMFINQTPYEYRQPVRVYKNFLYGEVEDQCSKHWNWQKPEKEYQDAELKEGGLLFVQFYDNTTKKYYHQFVTVNKVYHAGLVQIDRQIGISVPVTNSKLPTVSRIINCQMIFDDELSDNHTHKNSYLRKDIMRMSSTTQEGQRLGCICGKGNPVLAIDMDVTVGKKLWKNDYEVYVTSNRLIRNYQSVKYQLYRSCQTINCSKFENKNGQLAHYEAGFTKIVKLTQNNKIYNVTSENFDHIFIVRIHREGVIKMTTVDSEGISHTYILTEGQLLRIRQYENGTKEIEKENYYYENITLSSAEGKTKYLYIYVSKLPNGTYIGGIWNIKDPLHFPRMRLVNEKLVSFEHRSGYSYIRQLDPKKMKDPKAMALVNYVSLLSKHYQWEQPSESKEQPKQFFLNESYSINYTYTHGDMCGPPFNKPRQTTVTLRCGRSWYEISEVHEVAPCIYWIQVDTLLLCKGNIKTLVENDLDIPVKQPIDKMIFNGMVCVDEVNQEEVPPVYFMDRNQK